MPFWWIDFDVDFFRAEGCFFSRRTSILGRSTEELLESACLHIMEYRLPSLPFLLQRSCAMQLTWIVAHSSLRIALYRLHRRIGNVFTYGSCVAEDLLLFSEGRISLSLFITIQLPSEEYRFRALQRWNSIVTSSRPKRYSGIYMWLCFWWQVSSFPCIHSVCGGSDPITTLEALFPKNLN